MRNLIIIIFSLVLLTFASCSKKTVNSNYLRLQGISICGNTLSDIETTAEEWKTKVITTLKEKSFTIEDSKLSFETPPNINEPHCGNCNPTGDLLDILVPADERAALKELGFTEI